ncbi:hypothetical protein SCE1572_31655 [Sorangium cellulosum So0157-2]|uniref:Uncharacterized protein n=1 Tax=Sorangium cellulosum So0157-2 TaxID=1254432 RepID=S4Y2C3_SORCE|nr:hypothetical protein SCE1572_31655 [Sorangium cellulosum So0157-2]
MPDRQPGNKSQVLFAKPLFALLLVGYLATGEELRLRRRYDTRLWHIELKRDGVGVLHIETYLAWNRQIERQRGFESLSHTASVAVLELVQ